MSGYQSHETFLADVKMYFKLFFTSLFLGLLLQLALLLILFVPSFKSLQANEIAGVRVTGDQFLRYSLNLQAALKLGTPYVALNQDEVRFFRGARRVSWKRYRYYMDRWTNNAFANTQVKFGEALRYSFFAYFLCLFYVLYFVKKSRASANEKFIRGTDFIPIEKLNEKLKEKVKQEGRTVPNIIIGETMIPFEMETSHFLVLGATRTGKGVLLNQMIRQINERSANYGTRDKIILYDLKGEFVSKHYDPSRDIIFYPYDSRSVGWNIFNEIESYPDFDTVAKSLYTATDTRDEYWYNCARDVFRMGLIFLKRTGRTTNRDLWDFFSLNLDDMKACLEELPLGEKSALKHIEKGETNQASTILSIVQERIQFFRYLVDIDGTFSLRKYIRDENRTGNLFLLNIVNYSEIFKPLMTFAIDTIIRETLSLHDKLDRRIFFVLDEIGSLYRLDSLLNLLTVGASKGASIICANQDIGRIEDTYGHSNAKTFFNNFNTNFILRVNEPETAEFISKAIGERQVVKNVESRQVAPTKYGGSRGISEQEKTERLILATEFQSLPNLEAILRISNFGVSRIKIPKIFYPTHTDYFIMKKFNIDEEMA
ncbi:MAG TPA: type IV secretion system DNA-binding domain-containing protein [Bacillota bacterium]|nr:type IV secretion system DNA-binding domain-containing protein [Bacillota bacterium]HOL10946.1 type IV secretion system DNA-binding domain-containing protein [Bacillota bacterium]HPO98834.1 type IV secretion system DNA-binding domain-containing protein [Bacillota bacterium]